MFGFSKTAAGIDIGTETIRTVRIRIGKTMSLEGHSEQSLPEGVLLPSYTKENILDMKRFKDVLSLTLEAAGILRGDVSLSIPDQVVRVSCIEIKNIPTKRDEILKFLKWKSKRLLPYDPEVAKIDYHLTGDSAMAVFIKGDIVADYEKALLSLSLKPSLVSTPSLNLFNLFSHRFGDLKEFAFISVLKDVLAIVIVKDGVIDFYRSTEVGYTDDRLIQEISSSILFYTSEKPDVSIKKAFLYAGIGDSDILETHLSDSTGMDIETLRLASMIKGPDGLDLEPYGPAVAAALCGK